MADDVVRIYSAAAMNVNEGNGAWAALLTSGDHRRTESGVEPAAVLERLQLAAVVRALECLTRPVSVVVEVTSPYARDGGRAHAGSER